MNEIHLIFKIIRIMTLYNNNIEKLGTVTATYEPYNNIDARNFTEPANIFMKNFFNRARYHISPKGDFEHPVLYHELHLSIPDLVYFEKQLIDYCWSILDNYIVDKKAVAWYDDGTPADYRNTYDSYNFIIDVINHFKDCYEIQGYIDAWFIDSDEEYLRRRFD